MKKSYLRTFIYTLCVTGVLYIFAGYIMAPYLFRQAAQWWVAARLGRDLQIGTIHFNPFSLSGDITNVRLFDIDGSTTFTIARIHTKADLLKMLQNEDYLPHFSMEKPVLYIDIHTNGHSNIANFLDDLKMYGLGVQIADYINIDLLSLVTGKVEILDQTTVPSRRAVFDQISLGTTSLGREKTGTYSLLMDSPGGGRMHLEGNIDWKSLTSDGRLELTDFDLHELMPWSGNLFEYGDTPQQITASGNYMGVFENNILEFQLVNGSLTGNRFDTRIGERLRIVGQPLYVRFDMHVKIGTAGLQLQDLSANMDGFNLQYLQETGQKNFPHDFSSAEFRLSEIPSGPDQPGTFSLVMNIEPTGRLQADGWLDPEQQTATATFSIENFPIVALNQYIQTSTTLTARTGVLEATGDLQYEANSAIIDVQTRLADMEIVDDSGRFVFAVNNLLASAARFQGFPLHGSVQRVTMENPYVKIDPGAGSGSEGPVTENQLADETRSMPTTVQNKILSPSIVVEHAEINNGRIEFSTAGDVRSFPLTADDVQGVIRNIGGNEIATVKLHGSVNSTGTFQLDGNWQTSSLRRFAEFDLRLFNLDAAILSPFTTDYYGRAIAAGDMDLELGYRISNNQLNGVNAINLTGLGLDEQNDNLTGGTLPLEFAVALLEDAQGRIFMKIPVNGTFNDNNFNIYSAVADNVSAYLADQVALPFDTLAALSGASTRSLEKIPFEPGQVEMAGSAMERLNQLNTGLQQRPGLTLRIIGGYDPETDRQVLAQQQVRLHIALAMAAAPGFQETPGPVVFSDPKVQDVIDEFANSRLGTDTIEMITAGINSNVSPAGNTSAEINRDAYYAALFDALVNHEEISESAMIKLARYRAQSVANRLARLGIDTARLQIGDQMERVYADAEGVPVTLELEIFN